MTVRPKRGGAPTGPSPDVAERATQIQEHLGGMSVPFAASDVPEGLIRVPERRTLEVRQRNVRHGEPSGPELDPRSFDILNRLTVMKTKHLKHELGRHFEFVGAVADAVRTSSGRWYFRIADPRGQQLDVVFGSGLRSGARFSMHPHAGRSGYSDELTPEAALELARLVSTARLRPAPKVEVDEFEVNLDEMDQLPEDVEGIAKEGYRVEDLEAAKAHLRELVERVPARLPSLLREVARKAPEDYVEADLDRLVGMVAGEPVMLRAFDVDGYDGNALRMSRTDAEGNVALIEVMIQEYEDRDPGVLLRVAMPPKRSPKREFTPDLDNDLRIIDDIDDDLLTPYFEVTDSSFGVALLDFAANHADPPIHVEDKDTLVGMLDASRRPAAEPEPDVDAPAPDASMGATRKPLTKTDIRKFRRALRWIEANWDRCFKGNAARVGLQYNHIGYIAAQSPDPKIKEVWGVIASNQRFLELLTEHHPRAASRDVIRTVIDELAAMT